MKPELLSPAGDWEALRAATANGADAVYFGLSNFNARARATNFTLEELPLIMAYLHARNVRGFVAFNTLIFSDELPEAVEFIKAIADAGVDAVIVQDLGLVTLIRQLAPTLSIHASTQMTLTESRGIEFVRRIGVERVVLARELSLDDIHKVTALTDMPVEVFIHGALCVAYSGQCLTSEALGGRSANRGQCAQACRLPYELIVDGEKRDLGDKAYLLSPQDLSAHAWIAPLVKAGVISFKIEGRLKAGPYVAATTQTYRKAIDAAIEGVAFALPRNEELDLAQTFSRGLTSGFLNGNNHQTLVRGRFPKSRGTKLGSVVGFTKFGVRIQLADKLTVEERIRTGDGVLFDLGKPAENEPGGRIWKVQPIRGTTEPAMVELSFEPDSIDLGKVPLGCEVWKTDDPQLRKRLMASYSQDDRLVKRIPITATLSGTIGGPLTLIMNVGDTAASATWPGPLEVATKRATTDEEIRDQLARLGDTPFELEKVSLELPGSLMIPKSVLNDLRRRAGAELTEQHGHGKQHAIVLPDALERMRAAKPKPADISPSLTVLCRNLDQLKTALAFLPAVVYCDFEDLRKYKDAVPLARAAGIPIGLATHRIWKPGEEGFQTMVSRVQPDIVLVRNLASVEFFRDTLPNATLIGDFSLNVANDLTANLLLGEGLQRLVPSFDLNWHQFQALVEHSDPSRYEAVIHQHMPMFHNEFCVFAAFLSKGKDHTDCGRPCERHTIELRDRVGSNFPVLVDTGCRNTVFNSVAQSAAEYVDRMKSLGVRWFRIDLLRETPEEATQLMEQYRRVIEGIDDGKQTWRQLKVLNQLGVTRGTLNLL